MTRIQPASLLLAGALAWSSPMEAVAQETHGNITFRAPASYKLTREKDGLTRMRVEDGESWLEIRLLPGTKLEGSIEDHADRFVKLIEKSNPTEFRIEVARTTKTPKNAERVCNIGASAINPNAPGTYSYFLVWCYLAGGRVETVVLNTNSPQLYTKQQPTIERVLNGLRFSSAKVLAEGKPPLTEFAYERTVGFVEWLLEIPMTESQRAAIKEALIESWTKEDKETIDGTQELSNAVDELASKSEDEKRAIRVILRDKVLTEWRKGKEPVERMLAGVWDAAHEPIVAGEPPLTQQVCDATAEAYFLISCAVAGLGMQTPDKELLGKWTDLLKSRYPQMPKEAREGLQQMPIFAAALRAGWPTMPDAEKQPLLAQWKTIPGVVELGKQLSETSMKNLVDLQARMNANNMRFQMMSNILRMQHETSMTIIRNMSGSPWRYEYRYR